MATWMVDQGPLPADTQQGPPPSLPGGWAEDYENQMVNDWLTKLLDDDSRRNSLVDANAVAAVASRHLDHNDNTVHMKPQMGWPGYNKQLDVNVVSDILTDEFSASLQIDPTSKQGNPQTLPVIGSHDSGYGISPTNTGPSMGPGGGQFATPLMTQKTSVSASGPAVMTSQQKTQLRPICKSRHCDPGPPQSGRACPAPMGDRGHLRPVSSIVSRPGCAVGGSGHDLPTLPPPEYIRNMPPPPAAAMNKPLKPVYQTAAAGGGFRPLSRSWNVKRADGGHFTGQGPKARVYKTNSSWVKVPAPSVHPSLLSQGGGGPKSLMTGVVQMEPPAARYTPGPPGPGAELHLRLEQVIEFFKRMERDRKATEAELSRMFPGKKLTTSGINFQSFPRLPPNPSRVDRVICDNLREHARVSLLIKKMERLAVRSGSGACNSSRSSKHMATWKEAVELVQLRRSQEMHVMDKNDKEHILPLAQAIAQLSGAIKRVRTVLWCTLQSTVTTPKNV